VKRRMTCAAVVTALVVAGLSGPAGTWLQTRELWIHDGDAPTALYLVAGEKDQDRRVEAAARWLCPPSGGQRVGTVLIGNDWSVGPYSRRYQRRLTVAEWAVEKMQMRGVTNLTIVPGRITGTDSEMAALAVYLEGQSENRMLVVVTSPYHVRRVVSALQRHLRPGVDIRVLCATARWQDRAPWTVTAELLKLVRDHLGLSRAPFISREWFWRKQPSQTPQQSERKGIAPAKCFAANQSACCWRPPEVAESEVRRSDALPLRFRSQLRPEQPADAGRVIV